MTSLAENGTTQEAMDGSGLDDLSVAVSALSVGNSKATKTASYEQVAAHSGSPYPAPD